jgi:hypothetical protein
LHRNDVLYSFIRLTQVFDGNKGVCMSRAATQQTIIYFHCTSQSRILKSLNEAVLSAALFAVQMATMCGQRLQTNRLDIMPTF